MLLFTVLSFNYLHQINYNHKQQEGRQKRQSTDQHGAQYANSFLEASFLTLGYVMHSLTFPTWN